MSEEEMLDIIDRIIRCNSLTYFGYNTTQIGYEALEKIVKQYKKQQKEIEELKNKKDFFVGTYGDLIKLATAEGTFNYISKDKIREKIMELENKMEKYKKENKENSYFMANYDKSILQELLGDE